MSSSAPLKELFDPDSPGTPRWDSIREACAPLGLDDGELARRLQRAALEELAIFLSGDRRFTQQRQTLMYRFVLLSRHLFLEQEPAAELVADLFGCSPKEAKSLKLRTEMLYGYEMRSVRSAWGRSAAQQRARAVDELRRVLTDDWRNDRGSWSGTLDGPHRKLLEEIAEAAGMPACPLKPVPGVSGRFTLSTEDRKNILKAILADRKAHEART